MKVLFKPTVLVAIAGSIIVVVLALAVLAWRKRRSSSQQQQQYQSDFGVMVVPDDDILTEDANNISFFIMSYEKHQQMSSKLAREIEQLTAALQDPTTKGQKQKQNLLNQKIQFLREQDLYFIDKARNLEFANPSNEIQQLLGEIRQEKTVENLLQIIDNLVPLLRQFLQAASRETD